MWTNQTIPTTIISMADNPMMIRKLGRANHFVKEWRKKRGLTQERLAERTPFSPGAISQLETGRTSYTQDMIEALADAMELKPGDLISRNPNAEVDVVALFNDLSEDKRRIAIEMLKTLKTA